MPDPRPHQYMDHDQFLAYLRENGIDTPQFPLQPGGPGAGAPPDTNGASDDADGMNESDDDGPQSGGGGAGVASSSSDAAGNSASTAAAASTAASASGSNAAAAPLTTHEISVTAYAIPGGTGQVLLTGGAGHPSPAHLYGYATAGGATSGVLGGLTLNVAAAIGLSPQEVSDLCDDTDPKVTAWTAETAFLQRSEAGKKPHEKKDPKDGKSVHAKKAARESHKEKDTDGKSLRNKKLHAKKDPVDGKSLHAKAAGKKGPRARCDGPETYHWCKKCQKVFTLMSRKGSTSTLTRCNLQVPGKTSCQGRCHAWCAGTIPSGIRGNPPPRRCPGCVPASMRHLIPRESSESAGDEDESEGKEDEEED